MEKINCDIIKDILPLYLDDVVSNATKEMVEEHLKSCDFCREEAASLKEVVVLPVRQNLRISEARIIKNLKERFWKRKIIISAVSAVLAVAIVFSLYSALALFRICIPYDDPQLSVTEVDGKIYAMYNGNDLGGSVALNPVTVNVDGQEQEIVIFYIYTTPWTNITSYFNKDVNSNQNMIFLGNLNEIDTIYYGKFNYNDYETDASTIVEKSELIWREHYY